MKILDTKWITLMTGECIGIVVGEDKITGKRKAYIGMGQGRNEDDDTTQIAENGSPLYLSMVEEILKLLKKEE